MIIGSNGIFRATSKNLLGSEFEILVQGKVKAKSILMEFKK